MGIILPTELYLSFKVLLSLLRFSIILVALVEPIEAYSMAAEGMDGSSLMEGQESEPCITLNLHPLDSQECKNNLFDEQINI